MNDGLQQSPHQALAARLRDLADTVPQHFETLLAAPEFERGQRALSDLSAPGRIEAAVADLSADEATWFEAKLELHWQRIAPRTTAPTLRLITQDVVWSAGAEATLLLRIHVDGLVEGWEVIWPDRAQPGPTPNRAQLTLSIDERDHFELSIRVVGVPLDNPSSESPAQRTILSCKQTVLLRSARCMIAPDRQSLIVRDRDGTPASGVTVAVAGKPVSLDADGRAVFDTPLGEGVAPKLDGIPIPLESS